MVPLILVPPMLVPILLVAGGPSTKAIGITNRTSALFIFTAMCRAVGVLDASDIRFEPACKSLLVALALASKLQASASLGVRHIEVRPQLCQLVHNIGHA